MKTLYLTNEQTVEEVVEKFAEMLIQHLDESAERFEPSFLIDGDAIIVNYLTAEGLVFDLIAFDPEIHVTKEGYLYVNFKPVYDKGFQQYIDSVAEVFNTPDF